MKRPALHLICSAHLDPVWQWRWEEGCAEALSTFSAAVDLLEEDPDLIFTHNESLLYRWVKEHDPPLFGAIRRLAARRRWCVSGGWDLQPDVNLPGTESIIRHIAEGRRFFRENFGLEPLVAYNFDSFGHSGGLPQILARCGYKMYIHMRPQRDLLDLPADLYRWEGADGSRIIGYRIEAGLYHTEFDNIEQRLAEGAEKALGLGRDVALFWGTGDHGGGANREDLERIKAFSRREKRVLVLHSSPELFYVAARQAARTAPVVRGGLQRVFTGCYTSLARVKRRAQTNLCRLVQSEALAAAAWWTGRASYPDRELDEAWRSHLFNDFHDILTGTCTEPAERDALDLYGHSSHLARRVKLRAAVDLQKGRRLKAEIPLAVFNTWPGLRSAPVEVECMLSHRPRLEGRWHLRLFREELEIPCQEEPPEALLPFNGWRRRVVFMSELPGLGSRLFRLQVFPGQPEVRAAKPRLRFRISKRTGLVEELEAFPGGQVLRGPLLKPLVVDDSGDSWGTGIDSYRTVRGRFRTLPGGADPVAAGPIRTVTETHLFHSASRIVLRTAAYADWPVLEFNLRILWNEDRRRLKLSIPTVFEADDLLCEISGGVDRFPADGREHVHGRWFLIQGHLSGKPAALGVAHQGLHGFDFAGGEVRLSVLRSAAYCHERGFQLAGHPAARLMDQGRHETRILVTAGEPGPTLRRMPSLADWLCAPPPALAHLPVGREPLTLVSSLPENIRCLAFKRSRDGKAILVRLQECAGLKTRARLNIFRPDLTIPLSLAPLEIRTLRIERSGTWSPAELTDHRPADDEAGRGPWKPGQ